MRVLITGASGIIGSSLLSFLTKEFHNKNSKYIFDGLSSKDIDYTNLNDVRSFINNNPFYDIIIFLVGLAHFKGVDKDYSNFNAINYLTLKNLLLSAQDINKVPSKMARLAWPKAKYGLYLAIFIIITILLVLYKDLIL